MCFQLPPVRSRVGVRAGARLRLRVPVFKLPAVPKSLSMVIVVMMVMVMVILVVTTATMATTVHVVSAFTQPHTFRPVRYQYQHQYQHPQTQTQSQDNKYPTSTSTSTPILITTTTSRSRSNTSTSRNGINNNNNGNEYEKDNRRGIGGNTNSNTNRNDYRSIKESAFLKRQQTLIRMMQSQSQSQTQIEAQSQGGEREGQRHVQTKSMAKDINQINVKSIGNRILNPNHILLPSYFPYHNYDGYDGDNSTATSNTHNLAGSAAVAADEIPLQRALVELIRSMEKIVQFESKCSCSNFNINNFNNFNNNNNNRLEIDHDTMRELEFILGSGGSNKEMNIFDYDYDYDDDGGGVNGDVNGNVNGDDTENNNDNSMDGTSTSTSTTNFYTIRVEQPLSHPVDPLCWLHANAKQSSRTRLLYNRNRNQNSNSNDNDDDDPTVIYMANAENTLEASAYGSSYTIHNLQENNPWDVIQNLPMGSRVFGGGRFDKDLDNELIGEEWKDFGKEMWILPAVELRREKRNLSSSSNKSNKSNNKNEKDSEVENGVNMNDDGTKVNGVETEKGQKQPPVDRTEHHPSGLVENDAAATITGTTLSVNLHFTSPSTLIESAKNVLALLQNLSHKISPAVPDTTLPPILSRAYNNNAQEVFEKGVNAALDIFQNDNSSSLEDGKSLKKVVLARRSDLHFGTELSGLDLMMKLKFGGNIGGHLFYMNPGKNSGKEFFGCAPERLFQVRRHDKMVRGNYLLFEFFA